MEHTVLVLLAAGDSRRFKGNKLLHLFHGKPMYRYLADEIEKLPPKLFERRIVVTQYPEIMEELESRGYRVVENRASELGISHSIELGIKAAAECVPGRPDYPDTPECPGGQSILRGPVCFAVCDQPYLKAETIKRLVREFAQSGKGIGCLSHEGELGNPAIFSPKYEKELLALEGDVGGRRVIRRHPDDLFWCEAADGRELMDIDVKQDEDRGGDADGEFRGRNPLL